MFQWLFRFPEFAEYTEFPFHLEKTPLEFTFEELDKEEP